MIYIQTHSQTLSEEGYKVVYSTPGAGSVVSRRASGVKCLSNITKNEMSTLDQQGAGLLLKGSWMH